MKNNIICAVVLAVMIRDAFATTCVSPVNSGMFKEVEGSPVGGQRLNSRSAPHMVYPAVDCLKTDNCTAFNYNRKTGFGEALFDACHDTKAVLPTGKPFPDWSSFVRKDLRLAAIPILAQLPDSQFTASSHFDHAHLPEYGRLFGTRGLGAWASQQSAIGEYIQVDMQQLVTVTSVATQGKTYNPVHPTDDQWVTSYQMEYSNDNSNWQSYTQEGKNVVFPGNTDHGSVVQNTFPHHIVARYLRVHPVGWSNHMCLRLEVFGCLA